MVLACCRAPASSLREVLLPTAPRLQGGARRRRVALLSVPLLLLALSAAACKRGSATEYNAACTAQASITPQSPAETIRVLQWNISGAVEGKTAGQRDNRGRHAVVDRLLCEVSDRRPSVLSVNEACEEQTTYLADQLKARGAAVRTSFYHAKQGNGLILQCKRWASASGPGLLLLGDQWHVARSYELMLMDGPLHAVEEPLPGTTAERGGACMDVTGPWPASICSFHLDKNDTVASTELRDILSHFGSRPLILVGDLNATPGHFFPWAYSPDITLAGQAGSGRLIEVAARRDATSEADLGQATTHEGKLDYIFATNSSFAATGRADIVDGGQCYVDAPCSDHRMLYGELTHASPPTPTPTPVGLSGTWTGRDRYLDLTPDGVGRYSFSTGYWCSDGKQRRQRGERAPCNVNGPGNKLVYGGQITFTLAPGTGHEHEFQVTASSTLDVEVGSPGVLSEQAPGRVRLSFGADAGLDLCAPQTSGEDRMYWCGG